MAIQTTSEYGHSNSMNICLSDNIINTKMPWLWIVWKGLLLIFQTIPFIRFPQEDIWGNPCPFVHMCGAKPLVPWAHWMKYRMYALHIASKHQVKLAVGHPTSILKLHQKQFLKIWKFLGRWGEGVVFLPDPYVCGPCILTLFNLTTSNVMSATLLWKYQPWSYVIANSTMEYGTKHFVSRPFTLIGLYNCKPLVHTSTYLGPVEQLQWVSRLVTFVEYHCLAHL